MAKNLNFSDALSLLKQGAKVCRIGWNGKGMFLYYVPAGRYMPCTDAGEKLAGPDGKVAYGGYIAMKTAQGSVVPWLASQTDVLAEDWIIYLFEDGLVQGGYDK
jgi:hypothetical protein